MIPIIDFQRRSLTGPVMRETEFNKAFCIAVRKVAARYPSIKFNPEQIIVDDATADAVFEAGVDLLVEVGIYNRDTQRVIQFSRDEVIQIANDVWNGPREVPFGKGKEKILIKYRTHEDRRPPSCLMGSGGMVSTEELYIPYMQSFLQEELCDGCGGQAILASHDGFENKAGIPGEFFCSMAEIRMTQEAARRAGKPDIYLGPPNATNPGTLMALCFPGVLERHNTAIAVHMMPELKLDWNRLLLSLALEERGMVPYISAISMIGLLCRGPEDAAIGQVANMLGQFGYCHGKFATTGTSETSGSSSTREVLWSYCAAARAAERHIGMPLGGFGNSVAGAGTEMAFYEKAAQTAAMVCSGATWLWYCGCRIGKVINPTSGLEARMIAEVAHAVAGMKIDEANKAVKKIHSLFDDKLSSPPEGKTFGNLYDVKKVQPTSEYLDVYKRAKDELAKAGIPFKK